MVSEEKMFKECGRRQRPTYKLINEPLAQVSQLFTSDTSKWQSFPSSRQSSELSNTILCTFVILMVF